MSTQRTARSPEFALLGHLYEGSGHGYDLHQRLVTELGYVWHISQSQAYAILKRLVRLGYVSSEIQEQEKLPTRQVLHITTAGRRRFEQWLEMPTGSSVRAIRLEFITRLYFAQRQAPEKVQPILDAQATSINATLDRLELSQAGLPAEQTFNRLSLQLRIQQLRSVLNWLAECRKTLDHNS
jgi:DNA-binding PadR family transcriptional regulator